jgi:hypothetical protein
MRTYAMRDSIAITMKITAHIDGLASRVGNIEKGISTDLLEALCHIYPEGRSGNQGHTFAADLPIEDGVGTASGASTT